MPLTQQEKVKYLAEALHNTLCWEAYAVDEDDIEDATEVLDMLERMGLTLEEND